MHFQQEYSMFLHVFSMFFAKNLNILIKIMREIMNNFNLIKESAEDLGIEINRIKSLNEILEILVLEELERKHHRIINLIYTILEKVIKFHSDYHKFIDNIIYKEL